MDQDRHLALGRELEDRREAVVVQEELLRAGMELDPARTEVDDSRRLADRILGEVEADERDHPSVRALGERDRPVVPGLESRMPVRLVEAEHEAAGDAVLVHPALELVVEPDHAVDVRAEVCMGVEDVGALGQLLAQLVVPLRHQQLSTLQRVVHPSESMHRSVRSANGHVPGTVPGSWPK